MTLPTLNYTTPEEFVDYYYEKLKADLGVYNVQVSKVGFLGFILNILGYTHFDLKNYYDSLFIESFVATAQHEESQYLQAAVYGYLPAFAIPATAAGSIEFDFNNYISRKPSSVVKREVYLGYDTSKSRTKSVFNLDNHQFIIDATYKFVEDDDKYYVDIITSDGSKMSYPSNSANIVAPLYSTTQYLVKEISFNIGKYNFSSHKTYYFNIEDGYYLSGLDVYVTKSGETTETKFDVEYVKYLAQPNDNVVFLRKLSSTNFMLEFGSGLRGTWVSEGSCRLVIKYCEGSAGNLINSNTSIKLIVDGDLLAYDYYIDGGLYVPFSSSPVILQSPLVNFDYSNGGTDPLSGEDLRDAIVNYIQTRDNFISSQDFYNIAAKNGFLSDFKFMFKKINVYDNIFYLYRSFRDRYQEVCYSTNHTTTIMSLTAPTGVSATAVAGGSLVDGTYGYLVDAVDEWGRTITCAEVTATTSGTDNSVEISWNVVDHAIGYRVYGRSPSGQSMYWDVTAPTVTFVDDGTDGTACIPPTAASLTDLIYLPEFTINSEDFVSSFLYKGNTRMNYYDGYILREVLRINFSEIIPDISVFGSGFEIPTLYLNLNYDITNRKTIIYLKSYQDIQPTGGSGRVVPLGSTFSVDITITGVPGISLVPMLWDVGTSSWKYEYINSETSGIFDDEIQIEVIGYETTSVPVTYKRITCRTDKFYQIIDISDQLRLLRYSSGGRDYLLNVPVVYKDTFDSDVNYYLDKIQTFITGMSFKENRMITDNVQCRFLNTYILESPFIEAIFVQGKQMISSYNWLDNVIEITNDPPVTYSIGDRYLVGTSGTGAFSGHNNDIAVVVTGPAWSFIDPEIGDGVYDLDTRRSYVWSGAAWNVINNIELPLKINITIKTDTTYVQANSVDLGVEKNNLELELADYLQKEKTGTNIVFYNSQIIDFIHNGRPWVKSCSVSVTDSASSPNQLNNGIEVRSDNDILTDLSDKLNIVMYVPPLIYWDVNNIVITLTT